MANKISAGLLMYRWQGKQLEVFLAHPGGPYFKYKDEGSWTIPKGELEQNESLLAAAQREFTEETGITPVGPLLPLGSIVQRSGKIVHAWAFCGDWDDTQPIKSNLFELEWPPRSGKKQWYPEIDRAQYFALAQAKIKINAAQIPLLTNLEELLSRQVGHSHQS
jgi:predicted NUDIX family NTP pyrophosphohydrolase